MTIRLMCLLNLLNEPTRPLRRLCAVRRRQVKQQSQLSRFRGVFRAFVMNLSRGLLAGFLLLSAAACEAPDPEPLDPLAARLEQRAQQQFASRPKTGMLRALEVAHRAA